MTRILAVSHTAVWPVRSGAANRRLMTLRALARFGEVDLLYVGEVEGYAARTPPGAAVHRTWEWPVAKTRPSLAARIRWLAAPRVPYQMIEWGEASTGRPALPDYDIVWHFRPIALELSAGVVARRAVVDFDDLEDDKLRQKLAKGSDPSARRRLAERRNLGAWRRYQERLAAAVDAVTVCKEEDRRRLRADNCFVVPNGFPDVEAGAGRRDGGSSLLLVGLFTYEPNADAAEFFVREVLPRVRARRPGARLRLVGTASDRVRRLAGPAVTVVGEVDDLTSEYERATAAVVPIRVQGGTRVKILEAFARRLPVVSTTSGCVGLGARDGEHLLVADDPDAFADRVVRLLEDPALRSGLSARAHHLYLERFSQKSITAAVGRVLAGAGHGEIEAVARTGEDHDDSNPEPLT